jgi:hypothetical protein
MESTFKDDEEKEWKNFAYLDKNFNFLAFWVIFCCDDFGRTLIEVIKMFRCIQKLA